MARESTAVSRRGFVAGAMALAGGMALAGCSPSTGSTEETPEGAAPMKSTIGPEDGEWIPSCCNGCFNRCGILGHVVDGVLVEIKGNPESPVGNGHLCAKGAAGIMQLYDPNRLTKPLKRTNPTKGFDQDPGWEEITWDEAYSYLEEGIRSAVEKNPAGGVARNGMVANLMGTMISSYAFGAVFEAGAISLAADLCGTGDHTCYNIFTGVGNACPDYPYNKYLVQFGSQAAIATRHGFNMSCSKYAESRAEGAKLVNVDPHMSAAGAKADLWLPIRPGTDAALALAFANQLVNELGVYDEEFLKERTNLPSLVNPETQRIVKDGSKKALYWDLASNSAKPYDQCEDPALTGTYEVDGVQCRVAFDLYREHVATYTPEYAEKVTTIPAATIVQIGKEIADNAHIGETIDIEGVTLPYRPIAFDCFSGTTRHKHALLNNFAIMSLNALVGSIYAVGGFIGYAAVCHGWTDDNPQAGFAPTVWEEEGLIDHVGMITAGNESFYADLETRDYTPTDATMTRLTPLNVDGHFAHIAQHDPAYWKTQPATFLWFQGNNCMKFYANVEEQEEVYRNFDGVVGWDIYLNDTSYYADVMIPEACYLERYDILPSNFNNHTTPGGIGVPWTASLNRPIVPARDDAPCVLQVWSDLADRQGKTAELVGYVNSFFRVKEDKSVPFDKKVDVREYIDSVYTSLIDDEHDGAWFEENGVYTHPRDVDEVYIWANGDPGRVPLYWDFALTIKEKVDAKVAELGIAWPTDDYQVFPDWKPCCDHEITDPDFDTFPVYYTDAVNTDTWQVQNAWINELNELNPYGYTIEMNAATAEAKGLASGDTITLTNKDGVSVSGVMVTSECIHPECVSVIGGHWGSQSEFLPNAKGKGVPVNTLVSGWDPDRMDYTCAALDQCVRVKVEKA